MNATAIRELRDSMDLSQSQFARMYHIPLSTLQKWEQGSSKPPEYVLELLARQIPYTDRKQLRIEGERNTFYYDPSAKMVSDKYGNQIKVNSDLTQVKKENLPVYLNDLFEAYYEITARFERDCEYDAKEDIIWH